MVSAAGVRLAELTAIRSARARLDGREAVLLAELAALPDDSGKNWIGEDVAVAMRLAPATAHKRLRDAVELNRRLPDTVAAMQRGVLNRYFADRILDATTGMDFAATAAVEARVLAGADGQTLTQFTRSLRRAVIAHDTRTADDLAEHARTQRHVEFTPCDHAMAELRAYLPLEHALAIQQRLNDHAHRHTNGGRSTDQRSVDQGRADALVDLCLRNTSGVAGGRVSRVQVNITIPIATLLGIGTEPADLEGEPVPAALARAIATDPTATWRRILTDPTGQVLDVGRTTYTPTAAIRRHVILRDPTCRFPCCGRRSTTSELDHIHPWAEGGPTAAHNLIPLCPRHHHLKHETHWRIERTTNGTIRWTTPHGTTHDVPPDPPPG